MSKREIIEGLLDEIEQIQAKSPVRDEPVSRRTQRKADCPDGDVTAMKKIIAWVNASDKSERTIRDRLERDGFDPVEIDMAVAQAIDYGFIDDLRYAAVLIRSRIAQGKGEAGIRRELAAQSIDIDEVPGWPEDFIESTDYEVDRALRYLERHPSRSKNVREGAFRKLVQKGYSVSVATTAARVWSESAY